MAGEGGARLPPPPGSPAPPGEAGEPGDPSPGRSALLSSLPPGGQCRVSRPSPRAGGLAGCAVSPPGRPCESGGAGTHRSGRVRGSGGGGGLILLRRRRADLAAGGRQQSKR